MRKEKHASVRVVVKPQSAKQPLQTQRNKTPRTRARAARNAAAAVTTSPPSSHVVVVLPSLEEKNAKQVGSVVVTCVILNIKKAYEGYQNSQMHTR